MSSLLYVMCFQRQECLVVNQCSVVRETSPPIHPPLYLTLMLTNNYHFFHFLYKTLKFSQIPQNTSLHNTGIFPGHVRKWLFAAQRRKWPVCCLKYPPHSALIVTTAHQVEAPLFALPGCKSGLVFLVSFTTKSTLTPEFAPIRELLKENRLAYSEQI